MTAKLKREKNCPLCTSFADDGRILMAGRRRRPEPTEPGNPQQLTINQHVHSRACIERFTDGRGLVGVLRRGQPRPFHAKADNPVFCAQRVWSQKAEQELFRAVEDAFQVEVDAILSGHGPVCDHRAITAYLSIWQIRAQYALNPPDDLLLQGAGEGSGDLTKPEEEIIERKGALFSRGAFVPGRLAAGISAIRDHDANLYRIGEVRWGVLRRAGPAGVVCPDFPAGSLWMPVDRFTVLVAGCADQLLSDATVSDLNRSALKQAHSWIVGHPEDVEALVQSAGDLWEL